MKARVPILSVAAFSFASMANASEIRVDSWSLGSRITATGVGTATNGTGVVQNPLQGEYPTSLGLSTANSTFDVAWDAAGFFHFLAEGQHAAAGHNGLFSRSTGVVFFTPQVDSILSLNLVYNYALGNGDREAFVSVYFGENGQSALWNHVGLAATLNGQFVGQLSYDPADIFLRAGVAYGLSYRLEIESFSGSPSILSTGNGSVQFTVAPIPEPATLAMLLPALLLFRRPSRAR